MQRRSMRRVIEVLVVAGVALCTMGAGSCFGPTEKKAHVTYTGTFSVPRVMQNTTVSPAFTMTCTHNSTITGTFSVTIPEEGRPGGFSGTSSYTSTATQSGPPVLTITGNSAGANPTCFTVAGSTTSSWAPPVGGSWANMSAEQTQVAEEITNTFAFTGALSGGVISGTIVIGENGLVTATGGLPTMHTSTLTIAVTLR